MMCVLEDVVVGLRSLFVGVILRGCVCEGSKKMLSKICWEPSEHSFGNSDLLCVG